MKYLIHIMNYTKVIDKIREFASIPEQLIGIRESIERENNATRVAYERANQQQQEQWRRIEGRLSEKELQEGQAEKGKPQRTQDSIKRTAWATCAAAFFYAAITVLLWINARDQVQMENRSWVVFDTNYSDAMQLGINDAEVFVPFRLVNIGKTPAISVDGFVMVEELQKREHSDFIYRADRASPIRVGILYPSLEYAQTTEIGEFTEGHKPVLVTERKRKEFKDGEVVFNVWGRLTYFDAFQQQHFVQFCHAIAQSPTAKTKGCADHNLVDTPTTLASIKAIFRR